MKRSILLVLIASMLLSSCVKETDDKKQETTETQKEEVQEVVETEETYEPDNLPDDLDFDGAEIRFSTYDEYLNIVSPEEATGDMLNDAVYNRNIVVEERLNVNIETYSVDVDWASYAGYVKRSITAGSGDIDVHHLWQYDFVPFITDNYFYELSNAPYLDFSKPWWAGDYLKEMSIDGKSIYFLMGDISYGMMDWMTCMFYNKEIYTDHFQDGDGLYQIVLDGEWTIDRLFEYSETFYVDENGDGKKNSGDTLGIALLAAQGGNSVYHLVFNADNHITQRDSDGYPVLLGVTDRLVTSIDKVSNLLNNNKGTMLIGEPVVGQEANCRAYFAEGLSGFIFGHFGDLLSAEYRNMEADYGIIPYPKLDVSQETYLSNVHNVALMYGIPSDCQQLETVCAVMEALASESYRKVMPVYYEIILKQKYSRDQQSSQILDMLHDNAFADFGFIMGLGIHSAIKDECNKSSQNIASWYASHEKSLNTKIQSYIDKVRENLS